jgi:hypothetical protein
MPGFAVYMFYGQFVGCPLRFNLGNARGIKLFFELLSDRVVFLDVAAKSPFFANQRAFQSLMTPTRIP